MHQHLHSKHQQSKFQHAIHSFNISHHCRMPHSCQIPKVLCKPTTLHHKIQTHSHCKTQIYHHYKFSLFHSRTQSHSHYKTQLWHHHLAPHHLPQCHPKQPCQLPLEDPQESTVPHQKLHTAIWQLLASHSLSVRREALRKAKEAAKKGHPSKMAFTMMAKLLPAIFTWEE